MSLGNRPKIVKCAERLLRWEILVLKRDVGNAKLVLGCVTTAYKSTTLLATFPYISSTPRECNLLKTTGTSSYTIDRNNLRNV